MKSILITPHASLIEYTDDRRIVLDPCSGTDVIDPRKKNSILPFRSISTLYEHMLLENTLTFKDTQREETRFYYHDGPGGTFMDIFNSFGPKLERLAFTHGQIKNFYKKYIEDRYNINQLRYGLSDSVAQAFLCAPENGPMHVVFCYFFQKFLTVSHYDFDFSQIWGTQSNARKSMKIILPESAFS